MSPAPLSDSNTSYNPAGTREGILDPSLKKRIGYTSESEITPEDRCYVMGLAAARVPSETILQECGVSPQITATILESARKDPQEYQGGIEAIRPREGGDYESSVDALRLG